MANQPVYFFPIREAKTAVLLHSMLLAWTDTVVGERNSDHVEGLLAATTYHILRQQNVPYSATCPIFLIVNV